VAKFLSIKGLGKQEGEKKQIFKTSGAELNCRFYNGEIISTTKLGALTLRRCCGG